MPPRHYTLKDFDYYLPEDLIAQYPSEKRDQSRLFIVHRNSGSFEHHCFKDIVNYINPGDIMVFNNARVSPARIYCKRTSGGIVELILTQKISPYQWLALCNKKSRLKDGEVIRSVRNSDFSFKIESISHDSVLISSSMPLNDDLLDRIGLIPLPPYIKRQAELQDSYRYQTVYSTHSGAAASPTAGLHFSEELLGTLKEKGVDIAFLTLVVSWGTFQSLRHDNINDNKLHSEYYILSNTTAEEINNHRLNKKKIIAVGTTTLRVLESTLHDGANIAGSGLTDLFIYPPHQIKSADCLITNFHTPCSSLLMLVSAFAGYETIKRAYSSAIDLKYRFFSYGDAMLIID